MSKNIVLGELGDLRGNDVMKFLAGVATRVQTPAVVSDDWEFEISGDFTKALDFASLGLLTWGNTGGNRWVGFSASGFTIDAEHVVHFSVAGLLDAETITVSSNPSGSTLKKDGVMVATGATAGDAPFENIMGGFSSGALTAWTMDATVSAVRLTIGGTVYYDYTMNGQFGNATVLDSSGNGNHGTINSAQWWKTLPNGEPVDQVFANATIYNDQLPEVPVEFQNVIDINTDAPKTNDAFWGVYTSDWLVVTLQMSAILILLLQMEMEKMKILRTIQADIIGAGVATFNQDITSLMSTGSGILSVKIGSDTVFRELTITSDGRFYPVGNIRAIDTDSPTTVDLSLVTLGFPSIYSEVAISNDA